MKPNLLPNLFAFWRYSTFAYVRGGAIKEMRDDGWVRTHEYGHMWFKPIKLMPLAAGRKLYEKIKQIEDSYTRVCAVTERDFLSKVVELLPEALLK
jgi:hypothetical protein